MRRSTLIGFLVGKALGDGIGLVGSRRGIGLLPRLGGGGCTARSRRARDRDDLNLGD